jgi:hypothetical protein
MKRISLVAALLGALAFSAIALAGGTTVLHYDTSYVDPQFGAVHCTGVNQVKNNGAVKGTVQDSFTCASTTGLPLTNLMPGQALNLGNIPGGGWVSDFNTAWALSLDAKVSADGMSYSGVAVYQTP